MNQSSSLDHNMFHSSSHPFDTMFVILCVIAGASSHSISDSSSNASAHLLNHRHRYSFIDLILDATLFNLSRTTETRLNVKTESVDDVQQADLLDILPSNDNNIKKSYNVCALLSSVLIGNKMKFCLKHNEVLRQVIPRIIRLAKEECMRITRDLRWNCTSLDPFLDRSSSLAFTREAALIRSMLNASMMYLIAKICTDQSLLSCGCVSSQGLIDSTTINKPAWFSSSDESQKTYDMQNRVILDHDEIDMLDTGSPLKLSRSIVRRQGCQVNLAFADALTKILFDADESRSLNKAYKILNEDLNRAKGKNRFQDVDHRDLFLVKWTKSAVNLHNNHVGRQIVRSAIQKQCRCHGLSGACQFQTCWDRLTSFSEIASSIRTIYLESSHLVGYMNLGSLERPDIYLSKLSRANVQNPTLVHSNQSGHDGDYKDRIQSNELAYIYESPSYCDDHAKAKHRGTRGRPCVLDIDSMGNRVNLTHSEYQSTVHHGISEAHTNLPGTCAYLCCGRGYYSELVLNVVKCDCRFKFCCKVECIECPRQRLQHYCS